jgi:hypothetical protein
MNDAESASRSKGMPVLRRISTTIPCEATIMEDIEAGVDGAFEQIVSALTTALTSEEESPKPKAPETPARIVFKGSLDEVNRFFYKRGWSDGFPVIPPTEDAIAEMLTGTDLPSDHLLGKLESRLGKATVEKIAVNAVMAGALPTHLPVLIAATKLLIESEKGFLGFTTFGFSTGSWSPFWIINGPIRNDIAVNNGSGALSPGNIANAAIGRAMGLIIKNIGGVRKGVEDMGVMGNPMKYSMVIAENEEETPWEPLHVEYGYAPEDSTITVSYPQSYLQHWPYGSEAEALLRSIADTLPRSMRYTTIFTPTHAKNLAREGWSKEDVKGFISEYTRVQGSRVNRMPTVGTFGGGLYKGRVPIRDTDQVRIIWDPRYIRIIVAGGPGAFIAHAIGGGATPGRKQTQKIEFPKNWDKLVKKYKDMVPTYAKY